MRFMEDRWKDDGVPLMLKYRRLYLISCQQEHFIQQMGRFSDTGWEWSFQWRRSLFDAEIDVVDRLLGDTEGISIHPDRQDKWVWKGDSSGNYSVGSVYMLHFSTFYSMVFNPPCFRQYIVHTHRCTCVGLL